MSMAFNNIQYRGIDVYSYGIFSDNYNDGKLTNEGESTTPQASYIFLSLHENMKDLVPPQRREDNCDDDGKLTNVIEPTTPQASFIPLHIHGAQVNMNGTFILVDQNMEDLVPPQRREGTVSIDDDNEQMMMEDTASLPGMIVNNWDQVMIEIT